MKKMSPFAQRFDQLPNSLPIFPLSSAIVMPGSHLPLNIFESRYLDMFKDAMRDEQLIGMIQPSDNQATPELYDVGCAARITRYEETSDGRLDVLLTGLCRFKVLKEVTTIRDYRIIVPSWDEYEQDFRSNDDISPENTLLLHGALRQFFNYKNIDVDWDSIAQVSSEVLLNNLISQLALSPQDKQLLVETASLNERAKSFCAILEVERNANKPAH